ncbi:MAG: TlpA family protein disulfide reductase [Candidatus Hydrogenedentota bacterium]
MRNSCALAWSLCLALLAGCGGSLPEEPPRYGFEVGDRVTYSVEESENAPDIPPSRSEGTLTLWVLEARDDGGWHIAYERETRSKPPPGQPPGAPHLRYGHFVLHPDGTHTFFEAVPFEKLAPVFPRLPQDKTAMEQDWQSPSLFLAIPRVHWAFHFEEGGWFSGSAYPMAGAWGGMPEAHRHGRETCTSTFDVEEGLIINVHIVTEAPKHKGETRYTLTDRHTMPEAARRAWRDEVARYFGALDALDRMEKADQQAALEASSAYTTQDAAAAVQARARLLRDAAQTVGEHRLAQQLTRKAGGLEERLDYYAGILCSIAKLPAALADWEAPALAGTMHNATSLHGTITVLAFWHSENFISWVMRPALERVSTHFADAPVRIVGVNFDDDPAAARAYAEEHGITWPSIQAAAMLGDWDCPGFPLVVVLDATGAPHHIEVRRWHKLDEALIQAIEPLVAEPTPDREEAMDNAG